MEGQVIVEIKAVAQFLPVHAAQLLSYLKQVGGGRGLLINFNERLLKDWPSLLNRISLLIFLKYLSELSGPVVIYEQPLIF